MSESILVDTLCTIYSVMLGFLWMIIQETYLLLVGTETPEKQKEKGTFIIKITEDSSIKIAVLDQ